MLYHNSKIGRFQYVVWQDLPSNNQNVVEIDLTQFGNSIFFGVIGHINNNNFCGVCVVVSNVVHKTIAFYNTCDGYFKMSSNENKLIITLMDARYVMRLSLFKMDMTI